MLNVFILEFFEQVLKIFDVLLKYIFLCAVLIFVLEKVCIKILGSLMQVPLVCLQYCGKVGQVSSRLWYSTAFHYFTSFILLYIAIAGNKL